MPGLGLASAGRAGRLPAVKERLAGLLLPAFSARRRGDLGIGDTRALIEWIDLMADHGVRLVQLLPINETGADDSPYNAISSVALDPVYLTIEEVPGVDEGLARVVGSFPDGGPVDYAASRQAKRGLLEAAWKRWPDAGAALREEFGAFQKAEAAWLEDYCAFRALVEKYGTEAWDDWPEESQTAIGALAGLAGLEGRMDYFAWLQWLCFRQWRAVRRHADERGVRLMGDIPIGVSRYSADVFFGRDDFDLEWCGGAPPETMFKHDRFIRIWGQNWGIPLYRWDKMEREGFPWWRRRIDKLTDVFHVFRIDHVLGFYRIYAFPWRPRENPRFIDLTEKEAAALTGGRLPGWSPRPDDTAAHQRANRDDGDRRLKVIQEAAGPAEVVGEDLGVVPDYVRPHLESRGIAGFRIPHWDADEDGEVVPGDELPECSFATYATHDHDPLPALWEDYRRQIADEELDEDEREEAAEVFRLLCEFAEIADPGPFDSLVQWHLIDALMACRSRYAVIMVTELFGMSDRINQPGTVGPHNWSFRLPWTADECRARPEWKRLLASIESAGRIGA